ncbi:competence protein CoiA family protein [Burkholderia sp. JSH-S8]|nr:competence protein CoiA family protein [Burkholderia sp. JSH-S8]
MKIPFALDGKGRIVDIHDVPPSVEGTFRCAECKHLVTRKQGDVRVWHFAHKAETTCTKAFETALHLLAKQILVESHILRVPALVCQLHERPSHEDITLCVERMRSTNDALPMKGRRSEAKCPRGHMHSDRDDRETRPSKQTGGWPPTGWPTGI